MVFLDVYKWKYWVKVNFCVFIILCISVVNICDFLVVFYLICLKFLLYIVGIEIKIEKLNRN